MAFREEYARAPRGETAEDRPDQRGEAVGRGALRSFAMEARRTKPAAAPRAVAEAPASPDGAKPGNPRRRLLLGLILAAGLGLGGYEGYHWYADGRFKVSTDDAYVRADITNLAAKISGYVTEMAVDDNQAVKAGDVIARIDDGDYRLAVQSAKDKLATQQATIERIGRQTAAAEAAVAQASAQIDAARADATRAAADYVRQTQLAQSDYTSRTRLDQARADRERTEAAVKSAEAALVAARANVEVLSAQQTEAQRLAAELRTAVEKAERDLSFTVIRAPLDGVVGNKAVEVGTYVQPGTRLAALVPLTSVHVDANFKETQLANLQPGQTAHIAVDAYPDRDIVGTVESVAPASGSVFSLLPPENATGNFTKIVQRVPVRVNVSPEVAREGLLRPGLSVVVSVDTRTRPEPSQTAQR